MTSITAQPTARLAPIAPEERIPVLDVLRGFALLGIAIINMGGWKSPDHLVDAEAAFPGALNRAAGWLIDVFGDGKFNAIFSFLFGVGLTIQLDRAAARGASFVRPYLRRLGILLALGVGHAVLLWNGDVLHIYAVLGLLLLALRRVPDRFILLLILALLLVPIGRASYRLVAQPPPRLTIAQREAKAQEEQRVFARGTFAEQARLRAGGLSEAYTEGWGFFFMSQMAVTLLIGFLAGRRGVFRDLPAYLPTIRRLFLWGLALGLGCALLFATVNLLRDPREVRATGWGLASSVAYQLNRPVLSLVYIAAMVLLVERPGWLARLTPLATVGRMPLTNYLMQSLIATTIFDSYGFGLFGRVGPAVGLLISLAIYASQVGYSGWWMNRYRFGPLEWLWRAATYGHFPPLALDRTAIGPA